MKDKSPSVLDRISAVTDNFFRPAFFVAAFITAILLLLRLPIFVIGEIEIEGNSRLTDEYIKDTMDIADSSVFFWNSPMARLRIKENNYVDRVDITVDYWSRSVTVNIRERVLSGYVEHINGIFLYIDERGRVVDSATSFTERLPIVVGLEFSEFTIGEILKVDNPASFEMVVTLAQLLNRNQMSADTIKIDVSDVDDIHLYIKNIDVEFGGIAGADEKLRQVKAIMEAYPTDPDERGFINIRDANKPPRYRPLQ